MTFYAANLIAIALASYFSSSRVVSAQPNSETETIREGHLSPSRPGDHGKLPIGRKAFESLTEPAASGTAPTFSAVPAGLPAVGSAFVASADFDSDGMMDLLVAGAPQNFPMQKLYCDVWRNTGSGFTNSNVGLPGVYAPSLAWGDLDNDGRLDIVISGFDDDYQLRSEVWRNSESGFAKWAELRVTPREFEIPAIGSVHLADFDNDGRVDIVIIGRYGEFPFLQVWKNATNGFIHVDYDLPGRFLGSVTSLDLNSDGWLDLAAQGIDETMDFLHQMQLWTNSAAGLKPFAVITNFWGGPTISLDQNGDGQEDLAFAGSVAHWTDVVPSSQIWLNGLGVLTNSGLVLPSYFSGSFAVADYDSDGRPDFLATTLKSDAGPSFSAEVIRSTAAGVSSAWSADIGDGEQAAAWGDFDNDGRIDFVHTGNDWNSNSASTTLWRNNSPNTNSPPLAPSALSVTVSNGLARLQWDAASDQETPGASLTYNVRVGTSPGGGNIVNPMAGPDGTRRIPALGNARYREFLLLRVNPDQTYYWTVQAVDGGLRGGPFAQEASFSTGDQPKIVEARLLPEGGFFLQFSGIIGASYRIEAATEIGSIPSETSWVTLGVATGNGGGLFHYLDSSDTSTPSRFYRVVQQ